MKTRTLQSVIMALLLILPILVSAQAPGGQIIRRKPTITKQIKPSKPVKQVKPTSPATGALTITSTPSDAAIKIDGKYVGNSPLILEKQKVGSYQVTFNAEGYETQSRTATVTAGKTATCNVTLKKKQASQPVVQQQEQKPAPSSSPASKTFTVKGVTFNMVKVEAGTFTMGATEEQGSDVDSGEKPAHQVTLTKDYYIGQTEVTQALWQAVMGNNPSEFKGDNLPVENVSWEDCQTFITKLNSLTGSKFRLPTEAEWEYAARGGKKSQGYKYSGSNTIGDVAWYNDNSGDKTHDVGTKAPNELGIYDMSGNVWEWCQDWYSKDYYSSSPLSNPIGPSSGSHRVRRGGGWYYNAWSCRVSNRDDFTPGSRYGGLGLRLVL